MSSRTKIVDKVLWVVWMLICGGQALVFSGAYINVYDLPKMLVLCAGVCALCFLLIFKRRLQLNVAVFYSLGILIALIAFNMIFSTNKYRSFWGDKVYNDTFLAFILYFILLALVSFDLLKTKTILAGVNFLGVLVAIFGLVHAYLLYILKLDIVSYDGRITGTIGQANILGGIVVSVLPISLLLLKQANRRTTKAYYLISATLLSVCLLISMSRGAFLALGVIALSELIIRLKKNKYRLELVVVIAIFLAGLFIIPKEMIAGSKSPYLVRRFFSFRDGHNLSDIRFEIWRDSLPAIMEKPFTGWGNATFQNVYQMHITPNNASQTLFKEVESSHNMIVDAFLEWGFPASLIILLSVIVLGVKSSAPRLVKYALIVVFIRSLICITSGIIWFLFFVYLGLLIRECRSRQFDFLGKRLVAMWMVLLALSLGVFWTFTNIARAEVYEKKALSEGDANKSSEYYKTALSYNPHKESLWGSYLALVLWKGDLSEFDKTIKIVDAHFNDYRGNFYAGLYYMRLGETHKAIERFNRAFKLNGRDPKTTHYLGQLYFSLGYYNKAEEMFLNTVNLDTQNFNDDLLYLCDIALRRGDYKDARKYMEKAPDSVKKNYYDKLLQSNP